MRRDGELSPGEVARRLGCCPLTPRRWARALLGELEGAAPAGLTYARREGSGPGARYWLDATEIRALAENWHESTRTTRTSST